MLHSEMHTFLLYPVRGSSGVSVHLMGNGRMRYSFRGNASLPTIVYDRGSAPSTGCHVVEGELDSAIVDGFVE